MKKLIYILLLISSLFLLNSCFESQEDIDSAKEDILGDRETTTDTQINNEITKTETDEINATSEDDTITENQDEDIVVNNTDEAQYYGETGLSFLSKTSTGDDLIYIPADDFRDDNGDYKITGTTKEFVDHIEVEFNNYSSDFPYDKYTLQSFKPGDLNFEYKAYREYETLDYGKNIYKITAYGEGDQKTEIEIAIYVPENGETSTETIKKETETQAVKEEANPSTSTQKIGGTDSSYIADINCENLTDYLLEKYDYSYRNTCRPIGEEDGISFYVLYLDTNNGTYKYEKHYIYNPTEEYKTLQLKTGNDVTKSNIADKNKEFKALDFSSETEELDNYFKNL